MCPLGRIQCDALETLRGLERDSDEIGSLFDCPRAPAPKVFPLSRERGPHPFPFRTRKLSPASAMVLPISSVGE